MTRSTVLVLAVFLTACVSTPPPQSAKNTASSGGRYALKNDVGVLEPIDLGRVKPVEPRVETRTAAGNKSPYVVNGITYLVLSDEAGFTETGVASWYGRKFHGHLTSNGEIYDMFQLSAAHTILPIPSYIRVTNLDNGKSVIVRVNDRGPFHAGRVVDLSYAAAVMLGYADKGTARVRVEAIKPGAVRQPVIQQAAVQQPEVYTVSTEAVAAERELIDDDTGQEYLQVGAFASMDSARNLVSRLSGMTVLPVIILSEAANTGAILHKVRIGPLSENLDIQPLIDSLQAARLGKPFRVRI